MPRLGTVRNYSSRACPETLTKLIPLGRMGRGDRRLWRRRPSPLACAL